METTVTAIHTRTVKKWQIFPGKNKFCCDGRIVLGTNLGIFYFTCVLVIVTSGLFFGVDCPYLAVRLTPAIPVIGGLLFIFVLATLLRTSWSDPGIIPRATPQEAADTERQIESMNTSNELYPPPRVREIRVNSVAVKLKYCATCRIFRPPRAVHCSTCDNCVERFDHHCPWVGNCIGRRNYRYFYMFLVGVSLDCIFVCGCSITTLVLRSLEADFVTALKQSPTSIIVAVVAFFSMWSVLGLAGFHTFLASCNLTTNEDIKNAYSKSNQKNPFSHDSICMNYCDIICGPTYPSVIDSRGVVTSDAVNPTTVQSSSNGRLPTNAVAV